MRKLYILLILVLAGYSSFSQTAQIGKVYAKPGDTISVPVIASDLNNIGAMGFYINYDKNVLSYVGLVNINSEISSMIFNNDVSIIKSGWFSQNAITAVNADNTKLFDIKFVYRGGNSIISFDTATSIIGDIEGKNLNPQVNFMNGFVYAKNATNGPDESSDSFYTIYPNPTSGVVNVSTDNNRTIKNYKVFNVEGKEILNQNNTRAGSFTFSLLSQSAGVYFLRVESNDVISYKKLLKQ